MPTKAKPTTKPEVKVIKKAPAPPKVAPKAPDVPKVEPKVEPKAEPKPKAPPTPVLGKKYIFTSDGGEFIGALNEGGLTGHTMTIHEVLNGVQTERTIDMPDVSVYTFVDDKDEVFRRLSGN